MKSLLKVTSRARLGLILVSELALHHGGETVSLAVVAKKAGASGKFLEQIAGELRKAGIIEGVRGATGGYRLLCKPSELTIAEVLNAIEGPMSIDACTAHSHKHEVGILSKVQGQVMATLMNTTIADVAH